MRSNSLDILALDLYGGYPRFFWLRLCKALFLSATNRKAVILIRLISHFHQTKRLRLTKFAAARLRRQFGCFVQPSAVIGRGLKLPHPNGIVIGKDVEIGTNCTIFQQVTIGGKPSAEGSVLYPVLGNNVTLFAGAKVVGRVSIGDGSIVGANAVVLSDVPERHVAVGVPSVNIAPGYQDRKSRAIDRKSAKPKCELP
ncbi:Serine acetyltransferase [Sphingomonas paucimobilis]|nr:Serine acetyltransferase [Sphingomonas paucimobilis]